MKLSDFKQMNGTLWFLMVGTLFSKASYFISMPYLVRLQTVLKLDPVTIGWTLGIGPFVGIFCGFYIGHLSDHLGRKAILVSSLFIWAAIFLGFAYATELWHFALLNTINGICSAAYYPVSSALTSDLTELSQRKFIFHLRYYVINLGAAVGPLCGAWLILYNPSMGFMVTALLYFIFAIACVSKIPADGKVKGGPPIEKVTFRATMKAILEDGPLMYYTLAFVLMGVTYSQLESTLPQYLNSIFAAEGIRLFGIILGVNALTVVICQLPLTKLTAGLPIVKTIMIGSVARVPSEHPLVSLS